MSNRDYARLRVKTMDDSKQGAMCVLGRRAWAALALALLLSATTGCKKSSAVSAAKCTQHLLDLGKATQQDLEELRKGLPAGAKWLEDYVAAGKFDDATASKEALDCARGKVQDLRVAKATFFALVDLQGLVMRSDQAPDLLAGKNLFDAFAELRPAAAGKYVEARGAIEAASKIRGGPDAQWVAAAPVSPGARRRRSTPRAGLGPRMRTACRTTCKGASRAACRRTRRSRSPTCTWWSAAASTARRFLRKSTRAPSPTSISSREVAAKRSQRELVITEREFGLGFLRLPELGPDVGVAVLRSET
ncbi:MAG: hypothetical protein QM756_13535 [Polyangiaceae bacterium]